MQNSQLSKRLDSLDILRGLDIFFLVAFEPLFIWILSKTALAQTAVGGFLKTQLSHCAWEGFSFYDVIMPLFLFMTGAAACRGRTANGRSANTTITLGL